MFPPEGPKRRTAPMRRTRRAISAEAHARSSPARTCARRAGRSEGGAGSPAAGRWGRGACHRARVAAEEVAKVDAAADPAPDPLVLGLPGGEDMVPGGGVLVEEPGGKARRIREGQLLHGGHSPAIHDLSESRWPWWGSERDRHRHGGSWGGHRRAGFGERWGEGGQADGFWVRLAALHGLLRPVQRSG